MQIGQPWAELLTVLTEPAQAYPLSSAQQNTARGLFCCHQLIQSTITMPAQQHGSNAAQLLVVCLNFDSQNDCQFVPNDSRTTRLYSELTDLMWHLHHSLISLRLPACNIQKIDVPWLQILVWMSQRSEHAIPPTPVRRQHICHYFYLLIEFKSYFPIIFHYRDTISTTPKCYLQPLLHGSTD